MTKDIERVSAQWQYLTIEFNDTVIQLSPSIDTLEVATPQKEIKKYQINKIEKDKLFDHANKVIEFSEQTGQFCTDYVSKLKVRIRYNSQLMKEVYFSSICNWRELDANTKEIDSILRTIMNYSNSSPPPRLCGKMYLRAANRTPTSATQRS